jgi:hypothetical protein
MQQYKIKSTYCNTFSKEYISSYPVRVLLGKRTLCVQEFLRSEIQKERPLDTAYANQLLHFLYSVLTPIIKHYAQKTSDDEFFGFLFFHRFALRDVAS